ncbi:insulinase family protein [Dysgonomonas sp. 216]|uniref:M16 family metallopeptidase n=1 Tax=Dysgonomonas sp. 216 TaxID=2302934 RepID=UPI0013D04CA9|nr:M16 family metallopeptidase [Dysgonomonas sp. 216]NDW18882.1 insulinase family protein [Dysgonomonas sp. 216]
MRKRLKISVLVMLVAFLGTTVYAQGLKAFKLPNGLSVFVYEDETATEVFGQVVFNVGAKDEPSNYTGLAHYLEHVLFKGTEKIGALNWEKEKPVYEQIIQKYDERASETDPVKREEIDKEINKLTVEAAKYGLTNEFAALTEGMGGIGLNAGTSYDYTVYYNKFPPSQVYKWLDLNSERLINPVFRAFQTELETVYEEYNRMMNNPSRQLSNFLFKSIFENHPYSRSVIGFPEHLKNPQLSELIGFYNNWYVPENMALILAGKVKVQDVLPVVREKFGRLENKALPERIMYPETEFKGRKELKAKIGNYPLLFMIYKGIEGGHPDEIALDICLSILSNSNETGLIDKLSIDGDVMNVGAGALTLKERGRIMINAVPYYDPNQRRYSSMKSLEKMLQEKIDKLKKGEFEDWLVESIKNNMIRQYDMGMESTDFKVNQISQAFIYGQDMGEFLNYKERVSAITTEQIKEIAKKYFTDDFLVLNISEGKREKNEKLKKPEYEALEAPQDAKSDYAKLLELTSIRYSSPVFTDFDKVKMKSVNDKSKLFYTKNEDNEVFTLIIKYGIGAEKMPHLPLATLLMNNAGIMGQMKAQEVKQAFSNLGATCAYRVDDNYLYVIMSGIDANLEASCNLLTRQILFPDLDEKQMNNVKGMEAQSRMFEDKSTSGLSNALDKYIYYQKKSEYIDRPSFFSILDLTVGNMTGEFQRATDYEAEIHYVGNYDFDVAYDILSKNLPLKQGEKASTSPEIKDRVEYKGNTIYFVGDRDAQQSNISFYIEGENNTNESDVVRRAFNAYFSGGFNGLIMKEIREYRSMAYTAYGQVSPPPVENKKDFFVGYVGTQADKVLDALEVYTGLLNDMPLHPDRITNIKNYLKETEQNYKPEFRSLSLTIQSWKERGYTEDPAKENLAKIEALTFDDIVDYYNKHVKGRPYVIGIVGDPKDIDTKALEKYGKVVKLDSKHLYDNRF